eukprot:15168086-Ditylum_brightwellii.AAC.1
MVSERGPGVLYTDRGLGVSLQCEPIYHSNVSWGMKGGLCCVVWPEKGSITVLDSTVLKMFSDTQNL